MIEEWTHTEVKLTGELSSVKQQLADVSDERDVLKNELVSMVVRSLFSPLVRSASDSLIVGAVVG